MEKKLDMLNESWSHAGTLSSRYSRETELKPGNMPYAIDSSSYLLAGNTVW